MSPQVRWAEMGTVCRWWGAQLALVLDAAAAAALRIPQTIWSSRQCVVNCPVSQQFCAPATAPEARPLLSCPLSVFRR